MNTHRTTDRLAAAAPPDADGFITLSEGLCHYRVDGPANGPVILLIHGATVPAWEFDRLVPFLTGAGFRTVRADLYGHGDSDRPRARYEHALFVGQLLELLDALGIGAAVHVLGHSLGAALGARLVHRAPERFASLVLAAPLLDFMANSPASRLLRYPLLGECLMAAYVIPMLVRRRTARYTPIEDGRFVGKFKAQLAKPGFGRALLSMFRSGALGYQGDCYQAIAGSPHPLLLLHGVQDAIVTPRQIAQLRTLLPRAGYRELEDTAHAFIITHPEKVAPVVVDFFTQAAGQQGA